MHSKDFVEILMLIRLYALEGCATAVFVVFVVIESYRAIKHLLNSDSRDTT